MVLPQENVDGRPQYGYLKESALLVDLEDMEEKKKMQKMASGEKVPTHQSMLLSYPTYCAYITIFYFLFDIIIYTIFTVWDIFLQYFIHEWC